MNNLCISERWLVDPDNNTGISTRHLNTKQIKDFDAMNFKSVIVIRESDIKKKVKAIRAVLSELPESPENVRLHVMMRSEVSTLLSLLPPKESETGE